MLAASAAACTTPPRVVPAQVAPRTMLADAQQLVVVRTGDWSTTVGVLQRYERRSGPLVWTPVGRSIPIVVGRTGLAWGIGFDAFASNEPIKHEGDGKSPAGIFPLDTAFGFALSMPTVKLPYVPLRTTSDCVDDTASTHYNTVVDRDRVENVDWKSAEKMREISQYRIGVIIGYNAAPPVKPRGSCVFLHIWAGPESHTAGCTAMEASALQDLMMWLDPRKRPVIVQLTDGAYDRLRAAWELP
jgi:L,D-peptidoglycan transpeptidase YkuD (ErfK/YbiS/YcfS/YnhG family)